MEHLEPLVRMEHRVLLIPAPPVPPELQVRMVPLVPPVLQET